VLSEKNILKETKNHNPPLQVKWSVPYNLRCNNAADIPRPRTTRYGKKSLSYEAARLWNSLPDQARNLSTFGTFKISYQPGVFLKIVFAALVERSYLAASYQNSSSHSCFYVLICFSYSAVLLTCFYVCMHGFMSLYCMIIMLQLCFICPCFYDLLFMSYAACAISKYAWCIVCFTLHVKLTKIIFSGCEGQFGCVYLVWPNVHGIYTSTLSKFLFG
jgi:hypothetical protein